jgi:methionine synthase II (cobalamin-independent)
MLTSPYLIQITLCFRQIFSSFSGLFIIEISNDFEKMAPLFRAEQIGSLMRPTELLVARAEAGVVTSYSQINTGIQSVTEQAITGAVAKQLELGIRPITSGEYERDRYYSGYFERLAGMQIVKDIPVADAFRTGFPALKPLQALNIPTQDSVVAIERVRHVESAYLSEWKSLRILLPREKWPECKITMPPINHLHMQV